MRRALSAVLLLRTVSGLHLLEHAVDGISNYVSNGISNAYGNVSINASISMHVSMHDVMLSAMSVVVTTATSVTMLEQEPGIEPQKEQYKSLLSPSLLFLSLIYNLFLYYNDSTQRGLQSN